MILSDDDEGEQVLERSLSENLDSLLGSKSTLTPKWADSVRMIMGSGDSVSPRTNCSTDTSSPSMVSSDGDHGQHDQHSCFDQEITELEGELLMLRTALEVSNSHRRGSLNRMLDLKGNIRVFCRVRPMLSTEKHAREGPLTTPGVDIVRVPTARKYFQFDRVFHPSSVQDDVFLEIEPIIRSALDGHNVCIFAYGQTGTGKTFTMEGSKDAPGVVPRTLQRLFDEASYDTSVSYSYSLSMLEVYKGSLRDLLVARPTTRVRHDVAKGLCIQMGSKGYIEVENLTEKPIADVHEASRLYMMGSRRRSTSWTNSNDASSRSHCLLRINITCTSTQDNKKHISKLWLIDLGGSERLLKTNAQGLTMEEGRAINVSLSALGDVISALQRRRPHVPYRNSKLTQILRDSLGEDSKTLMLVHVSPKEVDLGETICSLSFATRARGTHLGQEIPEGASREKAAAMVELFRQMSIYEGQCQKLRDKINAAESLLDEKRKLNLEQTKSSSRLAAADGDDQQQEQCMTTNLTPLSLMASCEKPDTDSSTVSPARKVPRFMSPTASSRGKKSLGLSASGEQHQCGKTQQPPMTFTSGHSKRIAAPRLSDSRIGMRMSHGYFCSEQYMKPKRKLAERAPWPASSAVKKQISNSTMSLPNLVKMGMLASVESISSYRIPVSGAGDEEKFNEPSTTVSSPVYQSVSSAEQLSKILAAERSESKLAISTSGSRSGTVSRSRRRLTMDSGSMNGIITQLLF